MRMGLVSRVYFTSNQRPPLPKWTKKQRQQWGLQKRQSEQWAEHESIVSPDYYSSTKNFDRLKAKVARAAGYRGNLDAISFLGLLTIYYRTPHWQSLSKMIRQDAKCAECGATQYLHVHHRHYRKLGKEDFSDLCVLCQSCHRKAHEVINGLVAQRRGRRSHRRTSSVAASKPTKPESTVSSKTTPAGAAKNESLGNTYHPGNGDIKLNRSR